MTFRMPSAPASIGVLLDNGRRGRGGGVRASRASARDHRSVPPAPRASAATPWPAGAATPWPAAPGPSARRGVRRWGGRTGLARSQDRAKPADSRLDTARISRFCEGRVARTGANRPTPARGRTGSHAPRTGVDAPRTATHAPRRRVPARPGRRQAAGVPACTRHRRLATARAHHRDARRGEHRSRRVRRSSRYAPGCPSSAAGRSGGCSRPVRAARSTRGSTRPHCRAGCRTRGRGTR